MNCRRLAASILVALWIVANGPVAVAQSIYTENFTTDIYKDAERTSAIWDTAAGELRLANPFQPSLVGTCDTPGQARCVTLAGDIAYVADWASGLQVVDLSNPSSPTLAGSLALPGDAAAVAVDGDLVFVASRAGGLVVVDVTDPAHPVWVGVFDTGGGTSDVAVAGDLALVTDQFTGLWLVDVTDPAAPGLVAHLEMTGIAQSVAIDGDQAFVGLGGVGLRIVDITDPGSPALAGIVNTLGSGLGVVVEGDRAYLADGVLGLQIIDISSLTAPTLLSTYITPDTAREVFVTGQVAFVAVDDAGLQVVDISDPADPILKFAMDTPGRAFGVETAGVFTFLADGFAGLQVIRTAELIRFTVVNSRCETPGEARAVALASDPALGDLALVADCGVGLQVIDVSNPAAPTLVATCTACPYAVDVEIFGGGYAVVADSLLGLFVISLKNPEHPIVAASISTLEMDFYPGCYVFMFPTCVAVEVEGNTALVVIVDDYNQDIKWLKFDITEPWNPSFTRCDNFPYVHGFRDCILSNECLYLATSDGVWAAQSPEEGVWLALPPFLDGEPACLAVQKPLAFVAFSPSQVIYDKQWNIADNINFGEPITGWEAVAEQAGTPSRSVLTFPFLLTAAGDAGLNVSFLHNYSLDEADIDDLVFTRGVGWTESSLGSYATAGYARDVAVAGDYIYIADTAGLQVYSATYLLHNPAAGEGPPVLGHSCAVEGDYVFAAGELGLQVRDISDYPAISYVGEYSAPGATDVDVAGNLAFVVGRNGLLVFDVSDPSSPACIGTDDTTTFLSAVTVAGDLVFVTVENEARLKVIDVTNPAVPVAISSLNLPSYGQCLAVSGNLVLVGSVFADLSIIDVSNPASPFIVGTFPGYVYDLAVAGDLVFSAAGESGLEVIDIANPAIPTLVGSCDTSVKAVRVAVSGDLAFVADWDGIVLLIMDITNPGSPAVVGEIPVWNGRYFTVADDLLILEDYEGLRSIPVVQRDILGSYAAHVYSLAVDGDSPPIVQVRLSATQTKGVRWAVSANGGWNWQLIAPETWSRISFPGDELLWFSGLTWQRNVYPTVADLQIEWYPKWGTIAHIADIPNDQGRQVRVEWGRSGYDAVGDPTQVVNYAVYRKIDPALSGVTAIPEDSGLADLSPAAQQHVQGMLEAGWDFLRTVPVLGQDRYAVVVPTLADSTIAGGDYQSVFMVSALTATPGVFYDSPPDSGYSVDNLVPGVPQNMTVSYTAAGATLDWDDVVAPDLQGYRVYRGTSPDFVPCVNNLVRETAESSWFDPAAEPWSFCYKTTAVDLSGNESAAGAPGGAVGAADDGLPTRTELFAAVPNPFNPTTTLSFAVATAGPVRLRIYDVSGRLVRTLVDEKRPVGRYQEVWDGRSTDGRPVASGVYLYRLRSGGVTECRRMLLLK
ncbi:MAG: FlgD immunoglobulin-like domain containing protein [bacterium]